MSPGPHIVYIIGPQKAVRLPALRVGRPRFLTLKDWLNKRTQWRHPNFRLEAERRNQGDKRQEVRDICDRPACNSFRKLSCKTKRRASHKPLNTNKETFQHWDRGFESHLGIDVYVCSVRVLYELKLVIKSLIWIACNSQNGLSSPTPNYIWIIIIINKPRNKETSVHERLELRTQSVSVYYHVSSYEHKAFRFATMSRVTNTKRLGLCTMSPVTNTKRLGLCTMSRVTTTERLGYVPCLELRTKPSRFTYNVSSYEHASRQYRTAISWECQRR
jgi:hypothetical protein